jgi:hypothetical protein
MPNATIGRGERYGRLVVYGPRPYRSRSGDSKWLCRCDCRRMRLVPADKLCSGHTRSCGCLRRKSGGTTHLLFHGETGTRLHRIWAGMFKRCYNNKSVTFMNYGGRGIAVCEEWRDYVVFRRWALSHGYEDTLTIERTDNDGDYEPKNCTWATRTLQARNKRNTRFVTAFGETKCVGEWLEDPRCVIAHSTLWNRLQRDWSPEAALSEPAGLRTRHLVTAYGETKSLAEWVADPRCVATKTTLLRRLAVGWRSEEALSTP